ncbi:unnamed protein product [marine sediment metagenome]|uniref:Uncharacterized protein n=1 Tax=marine sediment metagenome TaxID=412755 RepID=X0UQ14_9ZZZZ
MKTNKLGEIKEIEHVIREEIDKCRNLGEHARGGSGHLSYRSMSKFKLGKLKKTKHQEGIAFEVICTYDVYTETEFMHSPDMDELYTEHYKDMFIIDSAFRILEINEN